jgi:hypothetical protein
MKQTNMFGDFERQRMSEQTAVETAPYHPHSAESKEAADAILPVAGTHRRKVYDFISARGNWGATDEEIQLGLAMNPSTQRPRRVELVKAKLIIQCGQRKTTSRRNAAVWQATKDAND